MITPMIYSHQEVSRWDYQPDPTEVYGPDETIHTVGLVNNSGAETIIHKITMCSSPLLVMPHPLPAIPYVAVMKYWHAKVQTP